MSPAAALVRVSALGLVLLLSLVGCESRTARATPDTVALEPGAVRQPIPDDIDPRMVEWRSDGRLVASRDSLTRIPGYVVDSIFPPEEAMRRFRVGLPSPGPDRLSGGAPSSDALLRRYWALLQAADTLAMRDLVVDRAEFAYLYLPSSPELRAGMPPSTAWLLLGQNSGRGLGRALRAAATRDTTLRATVCGDRSESLDGGRLLGPCGVIVGAGSARDTIWLANGLVELRGTVKLLSFSNSL